MSLKSKKERKMPSLGMVIGGLRRRRGMEKNILKNALKIYKFYDDYEHTDPENFINKKSDKHLGNYTGPIIIRWLKSTDKKKILIAAKGEKKEHTLHSQE